MARTPKPWYRKGEKAWFVTLKGKQLRLGKTKKEAMERFYDLMAHPDNKVIQSGSIAEIIEYFLDWTQENRAERTYKWYREIMKRFLADIPDLQVSQLKSYHIQRWLDEKKFNSEYKRACITAFKRVFNFAVQHGYIETNPISSLKKPESKSRTLVISDSEYKQILEQITDQNFEDLVTFLWEVGCRPQEATRARPKHVDLEKGIIYFPADEAPKGNKPRTIYLTDIALDIVKRNMFHDPLFVNTHARAWTAMAINCRFTRIQKKLGKKYYAYAFRHSYGYHAWTGGRVPPEEIAKLMGHSSTDMLYKVYGHVELNPEYMREAAKRVRG